MKEVHEEVFKFLYNKHKESKGKILFTLRQLNRYSKLDQGFWFLGNENYLAVSFWTGSDKLTRTPRIHFRIHKSGKTSLQLKNKDIASHTDYFHPKLLHDLIVKQTSSGWEKVFIYNDYIKSLDEFLNHEKNIIDNYVGNELNEFGATEWENPLDFINPKKFQINLDLVLKYRNKHKHSLQAIPDNNFIKDIHIKNYGVIKDISLNGISPKSNWIFLTGENGSGKTTILKAIATAICGNIDNEHILSDEYNLSEFNITFTLHDGDYKPEKHFVDYSTHRKRNKNLIDGFACYGAVRLLTESSLDQNLFKDSIKMQDSITYGLFNPISILKDLSGKGYNLNVEPKYYEMASEVLIENLEDILPNIAEVIQDDNKRLLFFEHDDNSIYDDGVLFENLPSGTRNFAALILDLLIRFQQQQPETIDPAEYKGIVLIDEIDIHLHPKLQVELVKQLSGTFPDVQFVVSTHSPIPILGAPDNSVFLRVDKTKEKGSFITRLYDLEENFKNLLPNALLTSDLFDLEKITHKDVKAQDVNTSDSFEKYQIDIELDKQLNILKINDDETFNNFIK